MSHTTILSVSESGPMVPIYDFENAWLSAMHIWMRIDKKYNMYPGENGFSMALIMGRLSKIWNICDDKKFPIFERLVVASTLDRAILRQARFREMAEAMSQFATIHGAGTLGEQAAAIMSLNQNNAYGVAWRQTSVGHSTWYINDESCEEGVRMYDLSRDSGHWFIDEEVLP